MGRSRTPFSHFVVFKGGEPCVEVKNEHTAPMGVLVPTPGAEPTKFMIDRERDKFPTTYARRRIEHAIERTDAFIEMMRDSLANDHPLVRRVLDAHAPHKDAPWIIKHVLCAQKPKPSN